MTIKKTCITLITVFYFLILLPTVSAAAHDYIDITNPFLKKMPIAIPKFAEMSGAKEEKEIAEQCTKLLANTLEFTCYFKILDPASFLEDPRETGIGASNINFSNWRTVGAELLITGGIQIDGDSFLAEMRLFDTFITKRLVGKKYRGNVTDLRTIILRFSSEIIKALTGSRGIFGSKIAFVSTGSGNKEIFVCDFDGYAPSQLTFDSNIALSPAWSSDSSWIAYTSYKKGKPDLYLQHLKDDRLSIVDREGINITPAWQPDKFALAATLSFTGDPEIYMLTGTGKIIKRLTNTWGIDVSPTFSPDGKKMAFVSKRSGTPQIYVMEIASGKVNRLTFEGDYNTTPSWSPSGNKIAFSSIVNGQFNINMIDNTGGNSIQLTEDAGDNESPTWSPDGSLIAFSSTREGTNRIYIMTAYGTDQRRLLMLPGEQSNPKWSLRADRN